MNSTVNDLVSRRSVRSYKKEQVPDDILSEILKAGIFAPTGMNRQQVKIVAVRNPDTVKKLSMMNADVMGSDTDPFYGAPCVAVVFADSDVYTYVEDGSLAMGNMMNAAYSLGVASCWIHRAREMFESDDGKKLKKEWGVPDSFKGIGNCILGYAEGEIPERPRKEGRIIYVD